MRREIAGALLAVAVLSLAGTAAAQSVFSSGSTGADGALFFLSPPPEKTQHAMAYDSARQVVVMFGGSGDNITREWDGTRWRDVATATSPPARAFPAMAYDSDRAVVVLFGGGTTLTDTWEYDGTTWVQRTSAMTPPAGTAHAMAYHAGRQRTVLLQNNQTWEWNGTAWTRNLVTSPSGGTSLAMAYDVTRDVAVLAVGSSPFATWEYSAAGTWVQKMPATSPSVRTGHAIAYDSVRQETVLFGGGGGAAAAETWVWNGTDWTLRTPSNAAAATSQHAMAFDEERGTVALFGGNAVGNMRNQTWLWNGTNWSAPQLQQPEIVVDMNPKPDGVWNYSTIDVPEGVTMRFTRNAANTPVVWLASGPVSIGGTIVLDGTAGTADADPGNEAPGGPGGFAGGLGGKAFNTSGSYAGTPGGGPGGGLPGTAASQPGGSAGHATAGAAPRGGAAYGNRLLQPLVGGSGGGGSGSSNGADGGNGGGGGGAMLIASSGIITVNGTVRANGGQGRQVGGIGGSGSGGSLRLVANRIGGTGTLQANSGLFGTTQGNGWIRLEAFFFDGDFSSGYITAPPLALGETAPTGTIRITNIAGQVVPIPPGGNTDAPDVIFTAAGPITVSLATTNIPTGTTLRVRVNAAGQVISADSTPTDMAGNASATLTVPAGVGTVQAFAEYVPAP